MTSGVTTSATAAVAPEIIAGRPPTIAVTVAIMKAAYNPTIGSTPAIIENAIASGISAKATTIPAIIFLPGFFNHSSFNVSVIINAPFLT